MYLLILDVAIDSVSRETRINGAELISKMSIIPKLQEFAYYIINKYVQDENVVNVVHLLKNCFKSNQNLLPYHPLLHHPLLGNQQYPLYCFHRVLQPYLLTSYFLVFHLT